LDGVLPSSGFAASEYCTGVLRPSPPPTPSPDEKSAPAGDVQEAVEAIANLPGLEAVLVNCCSPQAVGAAIPVLLSAEGLPEGVAVGGYANGFRTPTGVCVWGEGGGRKWGGGVCEGAIHP
jgi:hypothetical protein